MAHKMRMKDSRICSVCDHTIARHRPYRTALLSIDAAAELMDVDDVRLLPVFTQLADGRVEIDICLSCAWEMKGTEDLEVRYSY